MLFAYLSREATFPLSVLGVGVGCISLPAGTPLPSREPTDVFGLISNPFNTRHLYSNSFAPLASLFYLGLVMGLGRNHSTRDALQKDRRHLLEKRSVGHSIRA